MNVAAENSRLNIMSVYILSLEALPSKFTTWRCRVLEILKSIENQLLSLKRSLKKNKITLVG